MKTTPQTKMLIGIAIINALEPGAGISSEMKTRLLKGAAERAASLPSSTAAYKSGIDLFIHQNGTALFEGITVLFLAQFYGVPLSLAQQALVVSICILGGIGTAGIPAGSIPVVAMILGLVGIPIEGIGIILGVALLLDMCRTVLNVSGDLAAAVVVSRGAKHGV